MQELALYVLRNLCCGVALPCECCMSSWLQQLVSDASSDCVGSDRAGLLPILPIDWLLALQRWSCSTLGARSTFDCVASTAAVRNLCSTTGLCGQFCSGVALTRVKASQCLALVAQHSQGAVPLTAYTLTAFDATPQEQPSWWGAACVCAPCGLFYIMTSSASALSLYVVQVS